MAIDQGPTVREGVAAPGPQPSALLVIGDGAVRTVPIATDSLTIGRAPECEVQLGHAKLSRQHAVLRLGPPVTVQDLGSTNGVRIGGDVHRGGDPVVLGTETSFQIGPFAFVLVSRAQLAVTGGGVRDALLVDEPTADPPPAFLRDFAAALINVLVLGETGSGKEVLAQRLHALSGRTGPCVAINCAALSEALLESELFGHEQGAFTGASRAKVGLLESAHGGTVFLDEIGELPLALQPKLLRAIEAREIMRVGGVRALPIDVRFIAATHRELAAEAAAGRFRSDLYFRLDGITLRLAPLRARRQRIAPLAMQFVANARVTPAFLERLESYPWPGNVRELKAVCERAVVLARGGPLDVHHLIMTAHAPAPAPDPAPAPASAAASSDLTSDQQSERARIVIALEAAAGNQRRAAAALGISRATLSTRLVLYRIPRPRDR